MKRRLETDRGAAIVFLSLMMVVLLGIAAFAVDLGWLLVNGSRLQRAADSAALHGVTYLPGFVAQAQTAAEESAQANGFPLPGTSVSSSQVAPGQLEVTLSTQVDTFFLRVLGIDTATITRDATAEFVKPVPMGGDTYVFGNGSGSGDGSSQRFWGAIQGEYTNRLHGDPYTTDCGPWTGSSPVGFTCDGNLNATPRPDGYWLVVDVPVGHSGNVQVRIGSAGFDPVPGNFADDYFLGDGGDFPPAITTTYTMHNVDLTPFDPTDNAPYPGCSPLVAAPSTNTGATTLCTLNSPTPGLYPIHITASGGEGSNHYMIRALGGAGIRVYGINDISIFTNVSGIARVPLADIEEAHAGKTLVLSFYDPGDASGSSSVTIVTPSGGNAACTWFAEDTQTGATTSSQTANPCTIVTTLSDGTKLFNGRWIRMEIDIPSTYTCGSNCFWSVDYNLTGAQDRTVWEAHVIGDPVHLVIGSGNG